MSKSTDLVKILDYLKQGNSITFDDCKRLFGSNSLRERVKDLRRQGYNIITTKVKNENSGRYHAVYFIADEPRQNQNESAIAHSNLIQEEKINLKEVNRQFSFV